MLLIGTFGSHDSASRRYQRRCGLALAGFVIALFINLLLSVHVASAVLTWFPALLTGVTFAYIARELWILVSGLDELSRTLQLEALAIAYLVGLPVFMTAHSVGASTGWTWQLVPATYLGLDLVRAAALAIRARRYR
jgi:hypothetical protein